MKYVAILDPTGVLKEYKNVEDDQFIEATMVEVPAACDLAPGKYRYFRERKVFEPVHKGAKEQLDMTVEAVPAIFQALDAIANTRDTNGQPLVKFTERTLRWLRWYKNTLDAQD